MTPTRAVVITGASTGIGRVCAQHLSTLGFRVFAGVRKEADARALAPLMLDVTDEAQIVAAAATVRAALGDTPLAGLVNNAGIPGGGPLELIAIDELRRVFEVNVFGLVRTTQLFLPLLRESIGRVVNVSSIGGRVSSPFTGPYSATKFAVEALSDSLRGELRPWGMHVAIIEPGRIESEIWNKATSRADDVLGALSAEAKALYGPSLDRFAATLRRNGTTAAPTQLVADAVAHALTAKKPKTRYLVGKDAKAASVARAVLPDRAFDWLIRRDQGLDWDVPTPEDSCALPLSQPWRCSPSRPPPSPATRRSPSRSTSAPWTTGSRRTRCPSTRRGSSPTGRSSAPAPATRWRRAAAASPTSSST